MKTLIILLVAGYWLLATGSPVFAQVDLEGPVKGDMTQIISNIIKFILGLVGVLALIFFIYGGITWITSAGNAEQVKKGKSTLIWAVMGLMICFLAYSLVTFVITKSTGLGTITTTGEEGGGGEAGQNPEFIPIRINSDPIGAEVSVDGIVKGKTTLDLSLKPGSYRVDLELEGYEPSLGNEIVVAGLGENRYFSFILRPEGKYCPGTCYADFNFCNTSCGGRCVENSPLCSDQPGKPHCCLIQ